MFGLFRKKPKAPMGPKPDAAEATVKVYLNPLHVMLAGAEREKGGHLSREEVLAVRDSTPHVMMTPTQARAFYESLDARLPLHRMNPDRVYEEWLEIRDQVEWGAADGEADDGAPVCGECGSRYHADATELPGLCAECAHLLCDCPPCEHQFDTKGDCIRCGWEQRSSGRTAELARRRRLS